MSHESAFFSDEPRSGGEIASGAEGFVGAGGVGDSAPHEQHLHSDSGRVAGPAFGSEVQGRGKVRGGTSAAAAGGNGRAVSQGSESSAGSGNLGLARRSGNRRVVGSTKPLVTLGADGQRVYTRSYQVSDTLQFNQVDELQADAISRDFAQEIIEAVFAAWGIDTTKPAVTRKAEDVIFSFLAVRGASPYASYDLAVVVDGKEVEMSTLSNILNAKEVQRRRFTRAVADDLRKFIRHPDNGILRDRLQTKLAVFPQYVHLAFDGSTHCTGMNRNEVAFTKALESRKLFDDESVKGSLKGSSLLDGVFETVR